MKSIERKMIFRYIMIPVLVLTGCSFSNPFLSQFSDKGTLELLPVYTTDIDILSNTVSMLCLKIMLYGTGVMQCVGQFFIPIIFPERYFPNIRMSMVPIYYTN